MNKATNRTAFLSTIFWCLFTHGYRFANNMFTHDSLFQIYQDDSAWQIALGRIFQPILLFFRGGLCNPWLICFCAMLWYGLTVCVLIDLLDIKSTGSIIVLAGIAVSNLTITATNASFLQCADFFALALFLSCLGVWFWKQPKKMAKVAAFFCMVAVLGIYQAYICVSICLLMMLLIRELQGNIVFKVFATKAIKTGCLLLIAALVYFVI